MDGRGRSATSEVTKTMSPRRRATMAGTRARTSRWVPLRLTASTPSNASGSVSSTAPAMFWAALDTRISTAPRVSTAALANCSTESPSARSRWMATASPPSARMAAAVSSHSATRRAPRATGWPRAASAWAVAWPMPDEAPVTTAGRRCGIGLEAGHQRRVTVVGSAARPRTLMEWTRSMPSGSTS